MQKNVKVTFVAVYHRSTCLFLILKYSNEIKTSQGCGDYLTEMCQFSLVYSVTVYGFGIIKAKLLIQALPPKGLLPEKLVFSLHVN